jgi:1-acyl-sn-glycerol-3-phosphate acyltransferase
VFVRSRVNRIVVIITLLVVLPAVAITERASHGKGRRVALWSIRRISTVCGIDFVIHPHEELDPTRSYIFVANHSSPLDIPALLLACPDVRFMAAAELFRIPLLAGAMRALKTVPIARRESIVARQQLDELVESRRAAVDAWSIAIFPEGGIAPPGKRLPFKKGAFSLAIQTDMPIVPIAIHGTGEVLPPRSHLLVMPGTVKVELLAPISTVNLTLEDWEQLRDSARDAVVSVLSDGEIG